jgi:hypothetical protein
VQLDLGPASEKWREEMAVMQRKAAKMFGFAQKLRWVIVHKKLNVEL